MPRYSYACSKCETVVDVDKRLADFDRIEKCETCSTEMERRMSAPPFSLKGGGWASTGYQKDYVSFKYKNGVKETVPYDTRKLKKEDR